MSRFAHYSLHNQLLIFLQRPSASRVMGFQSWRQAGYQVRKGEKGIAIYAPMHFKVDSTDDDEPTSRLRFRIARVFDIAQVDPIAEFIGERMQLSIDYIRAYRGTPDTLDASLQRIRYTAARLVRELDAIAFEPGGP